MKQKHLLFLSFRYILIRKVAYKFIFFWISSDNVTEFKINLILIQPTKRLLNN